MAAQTHQRHIFIVAKDLQSSTALAAVVAPCGVSVGQCIGRQDCLRQLQEKPWDVLIVDQDRADALETVMEARRIGPWQSCIVLVDKGAVSHAVEMVRAGATDCLERPVAPPSLRSAVERGLDLAATLVGSGIPLTRTELTVLHLILAGQVAKDIARHLDRSKRTIDAHRKHIFRKLGVKTCVDMVKWAASMGLVNAESHQPHLARPSPRAVGPHPGHPRPVRGDMT